MLGIIAALGLSLIVLAIRVADEVGGVQEPSRLHRFADLSHRPPHRAPQRRGHLYRGMKGVAMGERDIWYRGFDRVLRCRVFGVTMVFPVAGKVWGGKNGGFRDVGRVGRGRWLIGELAELHMLERGA